MLLQRLLEPSFLAWLGWAASGILVLCFMAGLFLERYSKKDIFSDKGQPLDLPFDHALIPLVLFIAVLLSRYLLSRYMFGPWFFADEALDAGIIPMQFLLGEQTWDQNANYLMYIVYLFAYRLFGFSLQVARMVNALFFAAATLTYYLAAQRLAGEKPALFVAVIILISSPFITHSLYATAVSFAFFPTALILWVLSRPITTLSAVMLGPLSLAALFFYPGALLVGGSLIFFHTVLFFRQWNWKSRSIALLSLVFSLGVGVKIRSLILGYHTWTKWGAGIFSLKWIGQGIATVLADAFWQSSSWNTLNYGVPYLEPALLGFFVIGVVASLRLPVQQRKWVWLIIMVFFSALFIASFAGCYPGIRRIISSLPLLLLIAALGAMFVFRWKAMRSFICFMLVICFGLITLQSCAIITKRGPFSGRSNFMDVASQVLLKQPPAQRPTIVILAYLSDKYNALKYRAAFILDRRLNSRFAAVEIFRRSDLPQIKNLRGELVFFANEVFTARELAEIFGRAPSDSQILESPKQPDPQKLIAVYRFAAGQGDL